MKEKIFGIKRKILSYIIKGCSLTAVVFVFQACYGPPQSVVDDNIYLNGKVKSSKSNQPIKDIKVTLVQNNYVSKTDANGDYYLSISKEMAAKSALNLQFRDIDSTLNGNYLDKDTVVNTKQDVIVDVILNEK